MLVGRIENCNRRATASSFSVDIKTGPVGIDHLEGDQGEREQEHGKSQMAENPCWYWERRRLSRLFAQERSQQGAEHRGFFRFAKHEPGRWAKRSERRIVLQL
jgi:hypothetical protein